MTYVISYFKPPLNQILEMQEMWVQSLGWEHSLEEEMANPFQYSCLGNSMDRGAWRAVVHGVAESQTRLSDFTFTFHFHALDRARSDGLESLRSWSRALALTLTRDPRGHSVVGVLQSSPAE